MIKLKPWLQLFRISNLPTVASNITVGCALAITTNNTINIINLTAAGGAIALLYLAAMTMNDIIDLPIDLLERPERPIPSNQIPRRSALVFTITSIILALTFLALINNIALIPALALTASIFLYNLLHKKHPTSTIFMGICRALIYPTIAIAISKNTSTLNWHTIATFSTIIAIYTITLTVIARAENQSSPTPRRYLALLLPITILPAAFFVTPANPLPAIIAAILLLAWSTYAGYFIFNVKPQTKRAVSTYLAGFCIVDMYFLTLLDKTAWMPIAGLCFIITVLGHRKIMGT